jgi:hypothetical protein
MIGLISQRQKKTENTLKTKKRNKLGRKKKLLSNRRLIKTINQETENLWNEKEDKPPSSSEISLSNAIQENPIPSINKILEEVEQPVENEIFKPIDVKEEIQPDQLPKQISKNPKPAQIEKPKVENPWEEIEKPNVIESPWEQIETPIKKDVPVIPKIKNRFPQRKFKKKLIPRKPIKNEDLQIFEDLDKMTREPFPKPQVNNFNPLQEDDNEDLNPDMEFEVNALTTENISFPKPIKKIEKPEPQIIPQNTKPSWGDLPEGSPEKCDYVIGKHHE